MGSLIQGLHKHALDRRDDQYGIHRSKSDHPERVDFDKVVIELPNEEKLKQPSLVPAPDACSEFYVACRCNDFDKVVKLLDTITFDEINRMEPNGSTALHAACYHGHGRIVKLLLEAGADRAVQNKYKCLPYDEALTSDIKELFFRVPNSNRLVSITGAIEWELIDANVLENATEERRIIKSVYCHFIQTHTIQKMFEQIEKNYIKKSLSNIRGIDHVKDFFRKATEEQDPRWIIKAYTAETDFYSYLNIEIAGGATQCQNERRYIIALLSYHSSLDTYSFTGSGYRVVRMTTDDISKYKPNCCLMTKSFLSSSIDRKIAELFLHRQELEYEKTGVKQRNKADGKSIKSWTMCKYTLKHRRTGLHVENSSQYPNEGELLIMPYTVFKILKVSQVKAPYLPNEPFITEIELEECDQYMET
ncbi:unnamed protein product [Rotaria magnacalcarata]|uniref:NAD(+)--protein-arginine ADP-ribosyltransferase n=1 Tax=Rotaria magnacalcarata TaxID=392030 RepID=A0A816H1A8_9BILA|nr:unnamed protein product [Rotaria magnacalcarata]CAF1681431.1 unnamed protein product [Rotaria magnacalcarata]CAF2145543.1 unnamed protein product [Rotaria magnacalcarata]CAF3942834.1 unnamed protein product [Rotaria magnacalcarata]CAF3946824.1 unnamed protein product [Rotaria magnacalcarata]